MDTEQIIQEIEEHLNRADVKSATKGNLDIEPITIYP